MRTVNKTTYEEPTEEPTNLLFIKVKIQRLGLKRDLKTGQIVYYELLHTENV